MARRRIFRFVRRSLSAQSNKASGFTLLELIVVLTVVAMIAVFAIPAGRSILPGVELRTTANAIAGEARRARAEAQRNSREGWIEIDLGTGRFRRAGSDWRETPPEATLRLQTARTELIAADRGLIRFYPNGASTGGVIGLSVAGRHYDIRIDWLHGAVAVSETGK